MFRGQLFKCRFKFIYIDLYASPSKLDPDWLLSLDFDGSDPSAVTPTPELTASSWYSSFDSILSVASFNVGIQGQMNDDQNQKPEPLKALHPQVSNANDINYLRESICNQVKGERVSVVSKSRQFSRQTVLEKNDSLDTHCQRLIDGNRHNCCRFLLVVLVLKLDVL